MHGIAWSALKEVCVKAGFIIYIYLYYLFQISQCKLLKCYKFLDLILENWQKRKWKMGDGKWKCGAADRKALRFIKIGLRFVLKASQADADQYARRRFPTLTEADATDAKNKSRPAAAYAKTQCKTQEKIKLRWNAYRIEPKPKATPMKTASGSRPGGTLWKIVSYFKEENQAENLRKNLNWFCWPHDAQQSDEGWTCQRSQRLMFPPPYSEGQSRTLDSETAPTWTRQQQHQRRFCISVTFGQSVFASAIRQEFSRSKTLRIWIFSSEKTMCDFCLGKLSRGWAGEGKGRVVG